MSDLLLELFSEEIPARLQRGAAALLEKELGAGLQAQDLSFDAIKSFVTPRRLTVHITGLPTVQEDRREEKKGPRVGAPEKALAGFLKSAGLASVEECEQREDKKGAYYVAVIERRGRPVSEIIAELVPAVVRNFSWSKSMRWGDGELRWVRPLHHILCLFDGAVVPFEIDGKKAANVTFGHRFMAPAPITVNSFDQYSDGLSKAYVRLDSQERAQYIQQEATRLCQEAGLELVRDNGLLTEVAGLAEWPVVLMGQFDEKFLTVPDEVLIASMRGHQKYFSVRDPKTGRLANKFVVVANIEAPDGGKAMQTGYERVLTARLSDAWYLYHQDLKISLEERAKRLHDVAFFEGLGTIADKVARVCALAPDIAGPLAPEQHEQVTRAAALAKADLVSAMVYEFPELQGVMGRYYAISQGEAPAVADAIRDHYKPVGLDDQTPVDAPVTIAVALADKLDTLTAFFAIGKKPTGSSDPFALRRAALGVISLVLRNQLSFPLGQRLREAFERGGFAQQAAQHQISGEEAITGLRGFFLERLRGYCRDQGARHDHVDAVLSLADETGLDDVLLINQRIDALAAVLDSDAGRDLVAAYKRAANILRAEEKKSAIEGQVDPSLLAAPAEKALFEGIEAARRAVENALDGGDLIGGYTQFAEIRTPLDAFFEQVTVNDDDPAVRGNRLGLLAQFRALAHQLANFSKLEG